MRSSELGYGDGMERKTIRASRFSELLDTGILCYTNRMHQSGLL
jgi:hypothetical protein